MAKNRSKLEKRLPRGRPVARHGGYSYLSRGTMPENRAYLTSYLSAVREGLVKDLGPTEQDLSTAQIVLIDRCVTLLGTIRCIEEYVKEEGVFKGDELQPSLGTNYISFTGSLQRILALLGIGRKGEQLLTPLELAAEIDKEKVRENPE